MGEAPTKWLDCLNLRRGFGLSDGAYMVREPPEWAAFLMWCGWWMRRAQVPQTRNIVVVLLPDRAIASSFVAAGALLGSLGRTGRSLNWGDFLALPNGSSVYLRMKENAKSSKLVSIEGRLEGQPGGALARSIAIQSERARFRGLTITPFPKAFFKYDVAMERHLSVRKARKLLGVGKAFSELSNDFDDAWMREQSIEASLVTNRAAWERRVSGLSLTFPSDEPDEIDLPMADFLMYTSSGSDAGRVLLLSPRGEIVDGQQPPVAVLDGPDALRAWDAIRSPNAVILLQRSEYDEECADRIARLVSARNDDGLDPPSDIPDALPGGMEMIMFAISEVKN